MAKTYAYRVRMTFHIQVPDVFKEKELRKRLKYELENRMSDLWLYDNDTDDEEDDSEEDESNPKIVLVDHETIKIKRSGVVFSREEIFDWLSENPGYSTSRSPNGVKFGAFGDSKTYEGATLTEAVSLYLEDKVQAPGSQALMPQKTKVIRASRPTKKRPIDDDDEEDEE